MPHVTQTNADPALSSSTPWTCPAAARAVIVAHSLMNVRRFLFRAMVVSPPLICCAICFRNLTRSVSEDHAASRPEGNPIRPGNLLRLPTGDLKSQEDGRRSDGDRLR